MPVNFFSIPMEFQTRKITLSADAGVTLLLKQVVKGN